jgi:hypothetical protein
MRAVAAEACAIPRLQQGRITRCVFTATTHFPYHTFPAARIPLRWKWGLLRANDDLGEVASRLFGARQTDKPPLRAIDGGDLKASHLRGELLCGDEFGRGVGIWDDRSGHVATVAGLRVDQDGDFSELANRLH